MILNISEAANLAMHALAYLVNHPDFSPVSAGRVARSLGASEAHMSKVFQRLAKAGLVKSVRGPKGGFFLTRLAGDITLRDIYEAIDGRLAGQRCLFEHPVCGRESCVFGDLVATVHAQIDRRFSGTTLADLIE